MTVLIKRYREIAPVFEKVEDAAQNFLMHLSEFVKNSPQRIQDDTVSNTASNIFSLINKRAQDDVKTKLFEPGGQNIRKELLDDVDNLSEKMKIFASEAIDLQISVIERACRSLDDAKFIGEGVPCLTDGQRSNVGVYPLRIRC